MIALGVGLILIRRDFENRTRGQFSQRRNFYSIGDMMMWMVI
jgi:hypothetical protein